MKSADHNPKRVVAALLIVILLSAGNIMRQAMAQRQAPPKEEPENYHRPEPTESFKPQIPGSNRNRRDKVFLENADSIIKTTAGFGPEAERQLVKGNVRFRQMGLWMYCDSAYYYPELNSMDAFGHVRMEQGDTLFVYADKLFYNGTDRYARLRCGPTEPTVRLLNRTVTLTTDSLDYDLAAEYGWYGNGGRLEDDMNTLTSVYGEYSPASNDAVFYHDVVLDGTQNDFHMYTDTLYYNTSTHIARIETLTKIISTEDDIVTTSGFYNTESGVAELLARSTVVHKDSLERATILTGDSIVYDPTTRISRAYSFRDISKHPTPMVITDTARKAILIGGFGIYNDSTREAMATEYPLLMEYSQGDTLFLRADTIRSWIFERPRPVDMATVADSVRNHILSLADSIADPAGLPDPAFSGEGFMSHLYRLTGDSSLPFGHDWRFDVGPDSLSYQWSDLSDQSDQSERPERSDLSDRSAPPALPERRSAADSDSVWHMAKAYPRARFFRKDMQGLADTITFTEIDSLLRMERLPIVWAEERQLRGDSIIIHFNDSTADYARIPAKAMMMEHVEEDYFNQLHSDKMLLLFDNGELRRLEAEGSVQTIMIPMEADSTFNRLVDAESSFMIVDLVDGALERLKMWPEVTGNVTPLFMIKRSQKLLPKAQWAGALRPVREWYGDGDEKYVRWADDLGELSPELEDYFLTGQIPFGDPGEVATPSSPDAGLPPEIPSPAGAVMSLSEGVSIPEENHGELPDEEYSDSEEMMEAEAHSEEIVEVEGESSGSVNQESSEIIEKNITTETTE